MEFHRPFAGGGFPLRTEQLLFHLVERRSPGKTITRKDFYFTGNAPLLSQPHQHGSGAPGRRKDAGPPLVLLQAVAGEGDGDLVGLGHELGKHLPLLGGEIGEAVQPQVHVLGPGAGREFLRRAGQPVPWVQGSAGSEGLVGPTDETQIPQFVPLRTFHLLPRLEEQLRLDTAAFQLVHRGQQVFQKGGTAGGPGVHGQLLGHRLNRLVHKQQPSAAVQFRLSHASRGQEHPVGKAAEGQHLGVQGYLVPPCLTKGTLGLVGLLLRDHQHLPPLLARLAQALQHRGGLAAARPA